MSGALLTRMPAEEYNVLIVFSSIFLIFWGLCSSFNLYIALKCRASSLSDRLVNIRGLSETLHYFEQATRAHVSSLIQTRQSEPPTKVKLVYVPFVLQGCNIFSADAAKSIGVELSIWSAIKCRVYLLQNMLSSHVENKYNINDDLVECYRRSCHAISQPLLISPGNNICRFVLDESASDSLLHGDSSSSRGMAVMVVPCSSLDINIHTQDLSMDHGAPAIAKTTINQQPPPPPHSLSHTRVNFGPFWTDRSDSHEREIEFSSLRDVENSNIEISDIATAVNQLETGGNNPTRFDFGLYFLIEADETLKIDSFVLGCDGVMFSPTDMFGLPNDSCTDRDNIDKGDDTNKDDDDDDATEECLICLTEQKEVLLLPCKHFCVCSECFVHLDKCPVCRANFDKYMVLEMKAIDHLKVPKYSAPSEIDCNNDTCNLTPFDVRSPVSNSNSVTVSLIDVIDEDHPNSNILL